MTHAIDAGRAEYRAWSGVEAETWFFNVAGAGISGAVAKRANESSKASGGKMSYLWSTLAVFSRWENTEMAVSVDEERRRGRMLEVVVANGRYLAGGMKMCPEARPDDGLFDVLLIGDVTKVDLARTLPKIYRGTHLPHPKAELLQGRTVTIEPVDPMPVQFDGEQPGTTPVRFELVPRALRLRVPPVGRPSSKWSSGSARRRLPRGGRPLRRRLRLLFFGFVKASSRCSSSATRFSSGSRLRTFLERSSTRAKRELAASTTFEPPGRSPMNFWSASSPLSASRLSTSFCCFRCAIGGA